MAMNFFIFTNIGIVLGYVFVGLFVLPRTTEFMRRLIPGIVLNLHATTIGGMLFFLTCAGTHVEHAAHAAYQPHEPVGHLAVEGHMLIVHGIQVIAVWALILGVLFEFVRPVARLVREREQARG